MADPTNQQGTESAQKAVSKRGRAELLARLAELPPVELEPPAAEIIRAERDRPSRRGGPGNS